MQPAQANRELVLVWPQQGQVQATSCLIYPSSNVIATSQRMSRTRAVPDQTVILLRQWFFFRQHWNPSRVDKNLNFSMQRTKILIKNIRPHLYSYTPPQAFSFGHCWEREFLCFDPEWLSQCILQVKGIPSLSCCCPPTHSLIKDAKV